VGLRPFARWDCGFESHQGHGCLSLVSVVCCQVEVSASGWSLVQSSPTECRVSECDREASIMRKPWPTRDCCAMGKRERKKEYHHPRHRLLAFPFFNIVSSVTMGKSFQCAYTVVRNYYKGFAYTACKFSNLSLRAFATYYNIYIKHTQHVDANFIRQQRVF
jgi:hypothetical protein